MDYTLNFEMDLSKLNPDNHSHVNSTIANQLALYVTMYSRCKWLHFTRKLQPLLDAFQFIKDVIDWTVSEYIKQNREYITVEKQKEQTTGLWGM
jgi:hypothetical protein